MSSVKQKRRLLFSTLFAVFFFVANMTHAGNIVPENKEARFYDTGSLINFGLTQGDVTIDDNRITGYAWAEDWGWIHFAPNLGGVENDGAGNLSGFAWGETLGWINFSPTLGGVSIDGDGYFSGYAWAENGGWIVFSCETDSSCGDVDHRVQTTWPESDEETGSEGGNPGQQNPAGNEPEEEPEDTGVPLVPEPQEPPFVPEPTEGPEDEDPGDEDTVEDDTEDTQGGSGGSESEGGQGGSGVDESVPTTSPTTTVLEAIGTIIEDVLESPLAPRVSTLLATVGAFTGAASLTAMAFLTPLHVTELILLPSRLWTLLLAALGFRRKRQPWGTVYDSVTKQPLDPAYVQLLTTESNKEAEAAFTDLDGRFGFLPKTGTYTMNARKTNYVFPSKRLFGNTSDALYDNLYFGERVDIDRTDETVQRNIPLDPVGVDWNEVQKRKGNMFNFYSKYDVVFYTFTSILFYLGLAVSVFAAFFFPSITHTAILVVYTLITIVRSITGSPRKLGTAYDEDGKPLAYAAVRVYLANSDNQVRQVVTNEFGRFYCLVVPATYYVKLFKRVGEEDFEEIYTSQPFYAKDGLVHGGFGG